MAEERYFISAEDNEINRGNLRRATEANLKIAPGLRYHIATNVGEAISAVQDWQHTHLNGVRYRVDAAVDRYFDQCKTDKRMIDAFFDDHDVGNFLRYATTGLIILRSGHTGEGSAQDLIDRLNSEYSNLAFYSSQKGGEVNVEDLIKVVLGTSDETISKLKVVGPKMAWNFNKYINNLRQVAAAARRVL